MGSVIRGRSGLLRSVTLLLGCSDVVGVSKAERETESPDRVPNSARRPTRKKTPRANMQPLVQRSVAPEETLSDEAKRLAAARTLTRADIAKGRGLQYEWEFFVDQLFRNQASGSGGGSGAITYVHSQPTAAAVWTIDHAMSAFPVVLLIDDTGQQLHAEVQYPDDQTVVIRHGAPYSGTAYLRS